eukprot:TRINITY_DN1034_c0_g1_i2.p1 TRINITY_DN1034_c0_g1~~TRINITY_DN1034_c0_g1_i2.p1  ORF type:complete len:639 (+),score=147.41 TRINITY_DN1034_c0_g1_i2:132-1919(+)
MKTRVGQETYSAMTEKLIAECIVVPPSVVDDDRFGGSRVNASSRRDQQAATLEPHEVTTLVFSFKRLQSIAPLTGFTALTKLQLDNNNLSTIEHLDHLTSLTWLDLSFNQISHIHGLEALTNLSDLSLYANKITTLANLDTLTQLTCLSIGRNELSDTDHTARYLRQFPHLRMLTLHDNPLTTTPQCHTKILAFCSQLRYLDSRLVDPAAVARAQSACSEALMALHEADRAQQEAAASAAAQSRQEADVAMVGLGGILSLFDDMWRDDADGRTIAAFAEYGDFVAVRDAMEKYRTRFTDGVDDMVRRASALAARKGAEVAAFDASVTEAKQQSDQESRALIAAVEKERRRVEQQPGGPAEGQLLALKRQLVQLQEKLLDLELAFAESFDQVLVVLEQHHGDASEMASDELAAAFGRLRDEEKAFYAGPVGAFHCLHGVGVCSVSVFLWCLRIRLGGLATAELVEILQRLAEQRQSEQQPAGGGRRHEVVEKEKSAAPEVDGHEEAYKQLLSLLDSRDELTKIAHEAHEARMQKMYNREESAVAAEQAAQHALLAKYRRSEHARNRAKVCEINMLVSLMSQDIAASLERARAENRR